MRAVKLVSEETLKVIDLPTPEPGDGEVLIRTAACGICGSDLSCYKTGVFAGSVLGHELSGIIQHSRAEGWDEGARVVVDPKTPCGTCAECRAGTEHLCAIGLTKGVGQTIHGGFAEHVVVPSRLLHEVPPGVELVAASLAEPLAAVLHGLGRARAGAERTVVFGLGPIGLLAVAALRGRGATPIIGVDPVAQRRALAATVGADDAVEPGHPTIAQIRPSLVIETSGSPGAIADAGNVARPGARVVLLGIPMTGVEVWPMVWVTKEITVLGSVAHTADDWRAALDLLVRDPAIGGIITERVGLDEVPSAFARLVERPDAGKIVVVPRGS